MRHAWRGPICTTWSLAFVRNATPFCTSRARHTSCFGTRPQMWSSSPLCGWNIDLRVRITGKTWQPSLADTAHQQEVQVHVSVAGSCKPSYQMRPVMYSSSAPENFWPEQYVQHCTTLQATPEYRTTPDDFAMPEYCYEMPYNAVWGYYAHDFRTLPIIWEQDENDTSWQLATDQQWPLSNDQESPVSCTLTPVFSQSSWSSTQASSPTSPTDYFNQGFAPPQSAWQPGQKRVYRSWLPPEATGSRANIVDLSPPQIRVSTHKEPKPISKSRRPWKIIFGRWRRSSGPRRPIDTESSSSEGD